MLIFGFFINTIAFIFIDDVKIKKQKEYPRYTKQDILNRKKQYAQKVLFEKEQIERKLFKDEFSYQVWKNPWPIVKEIYRKYEEDYEWNRISDKELAVLIKTLLAEEGNGEVIIFQSIASSVCVSYKNDIYVHKYYAKKPSKRDVSLRKNTCPLSYYYSGPKTASIYDNGYIAAIPVSQERLEKAKKEMQPTNSINKSEMQRLVELRKEYENCYSEGLYGK